MNREYQAYLLGYRRGMQHARMYSETELYTLLTEKEAHTDI